MTWSAPRMVSFTSRSGISVPNLVKAKTILREVKSPADRVVALGRYSWTASFPEMGTGIVAGRDGRA